MRDRPGLLPLVLPLLVLAGTGACLGTGGPAGIGGRPGVAVPFRDGLWEISYTRIATGGDPGCAAGDGAETDTMVVADGRVDFLGYPCVFVVSGASFHQSCRDTLHYSGSCRLAVRFAGGGRVTGDAFTAGYTATTTPLGDCASPPFHDCVLQLTMTGRWLGPAPGAPAARGRRPVRGRAPPADQRSLRRTSAARRSLASTRVPSLRRRTSTPSSPP